MKRLLIIALMCTPAFVFAQTKTTPTAPGKEEAPSKQLTYVPETVYADLIVTSVPNRGTSVRLDFGKDIMANLTDKEMVNELTELRQLPFSSVPDALNYLASKGWKTLTSYNLTLQTGEETHIVMEKRLMKRPMDPNASPQKPPIVNKEPPVRPTEPRPTETKPKEKK